MKKIIGALVLGLVLVACGENLTDAEYLSKAQSHFDQGDINSALIEAKNALKQNPDNAQARVLLGKLQLQTGNPAAAEKEFNAAAKLGVPQAVFQAELSKALLLQGKREEVQSLKADQLAGLEKAEFLVNQALAFLSDNDLAQAGLLVDEALSIAPNSAPALLAKARLQMIGGELSKARALVDKVLGADASDAGAWSMLGSVERQSGNYEGAVQALTKAVDLGGRASGDLLKRAEALIQLKQFEQAKKDVDVLVRRVPNSPRVNYAAGQLQMFAKNFDEAQVSFEKVIRVQTDFAPALYPLAMIHYQKENYERAEQYANKFINQRPESVVGQRLLAMVLYRNQKYGQAEKQLRALLQVKPNDSAALNLLASTLHSLGKNNESVSLLSRIAKEYPESAYAQLRLGAGLLAAGDQEAGEAQMERAIALDPEFHQADVVLALHHLQQKEFDQALSVASAYRDKHPESALPYNLLAQAHLGKEELDKAKKLLMKAAELNPGDLSANHSLALLALRNKKTEEARGFYQSILQHNENHLQTLIRLASLDSLENKQESMVNKLNQAMEAHPDSLVPRLVIARYFIHQNQPEKVPGLFQGLEESVAKSTGALRVLATAQLELGQYADAKFNLKSLITLRPKSAKAQFLKARAFEGEKQYDSMVAALESALKLRPDYFDARLALASYLVDEKPEEARAHVDALKRVAPDHAKVKSMNAALQNKLGAPEKALSLYSKAYSDKPVLSNLLLLARQHIYMDNRPEAIALLESWIEEHPEDVAPRVFLANEYISTNRPSAQIAKQYKAVLEQQPKNTLAMNNLAWQLKDADPKAALGYAKKALETQPESAIILDTVAVLELKNDNLLEARRSIRKALKRAPENPTIIYHAAMIDVAAGDKLAAHERLTKLLQDSGEFSLRNDALQLLESLN